MRRRARRRPAARPLARAKRRCWAGSHSSGAGASGCARPVVRRRPPNLVAGINVQVCWEKFCRYWDVEPRLVPMEGDRYTLGAAEAAALCDENTIGVAAILGSTFDGSYEPVAEIAAALDALERERGDRRPNPRRRRLGRLRRSVPAARSRVGLPGPAGAVDQRLGSQVRPGLPWRRLGAVARSRRAAAGSDLRRQLPRWPHADVRAQLLAAGKRGDHPVPDVHEPRTRGLPSRAAALGRRRAPHRRRRSRRSGRTRWSAMRAICRSSRSP